MSQTSPSDLVNSQKNRALKIKKQLSPLIIWYGMIRETTAAHQIAFLHIQNVTEFTVDEKNLNMKMTENIIIFQVFF